MYSIWYRHCLYAIWSLTDSDGTSCCMYTIEPPEDERDNARNMWRIVILYEQRYLCIKLVIASKLICLLMFFM